MHGPVDPDRLDRPTAETCHPALKFQRDCMTYPIAYQLYSSRNFPPLEAQFPALRKMGYDAIEPWLPAYEKDAKAFRTALDDTGLKCFGFHMPFDG